MKTVLRTVIIEDEAAAARHLQKLLRQVAPDVQLITTLTSVQAATSWLEKHPLPDLLFMDIRLSDGLSFDILDRCFIDVPIIFTTAYDQYALQAFKTSGIDYLLKPISADDLERALGKFHKLREQAVDWHEQYLQAARLLRKEEHSALERILLKKGNKLIPLQVSELAYFYRTEVVFAIDWNGERYLADWSLSKLESKLPADTFFRLNRSYLVNLEAIQSLSPHKPGQVEVQLQPPTNTPIGLSTQRSRVLKQLLGGG
ncbi:MAG: LytTR family DNA-binding domain-containing protein [Bacteroidota bacterium]